MFSSIKARTIKLYNFISAHKKQGALFVFLFILGLGVYAVFGTKIVYAEPAAAGSFDPGIFTTAVTTMLLAGAALMIKLAIFCLSFIIEIAGYNGYLSSTAVQVGWVMVRDIANMFFVIVLLLVAFGTILGLEQYEWKKMLVKFFFAAILVNFSRVICGLMIDVAQVVMITFVNGIAATAGGNLISAFNLTDILALSKNSDAQAITNNKEIFAAAVGAIVFAALTLGIMLVFVFILLSRLLMLWILIVLSPFAFVFSVVPQTEKYASQWWSEFGNHVLVGPVVVFFLWLSFAVVGNGQINNEIEANNSAPAANMPSQGPEGKPSSAGITAAMSFDKIANFAIAIGILLVGAKTSQSLGTVGGSAMSKATDFAKKVAMVGSGVAAGMWAANTAAKGAKAGAKLAYQISPVSDWVERTQNYAKRQVESWKIYRSEGPRLKMEPEKDEEGNVKLDDKGKPRMKFVNKKDENGKDIEGKYEFEEKDTRSWFQKQRYSSRAKLIASRKELKKTEDQSKLQDELIDKQITAIPKGLFLRSMPDGFDRVAQGMLAAEKERSAAKTKEYQELGREAILGSARFKDGEFQTKKGTVAEQIIGHNERAERNQSRTKQLLSSELEKYRKSEKGGKVVAAKVEAKFKAEVSDKAAHLSEGAAQLHFFESVAGKEALYKQVDIAAREKEEHAKIEAIEKAQAAKFELSHDGEHIREARIEAENRGEVASNIVKRKESESRLHSMVDEDGKVKENYRKVLDSQTSAKIIEDTVGAVKSEQSEAVLGDVIKKAGEITDPAEQKKNMFFNYGAAIARQKDSARQFRVKQNTLMHKIAQQTVHSARGISVPDDSITAGIEEQEKEFKEMEYNRTVSNIASNFKKMMQKRSSGQEVTEGDKEAMAGLFKHAFNNSWVDDGIIAIMSDPELAKKAQEAFGWQDQEYTPEKINQLQSLWATGGDWQFAKTHNSAAKMMDVSQEMYGDDFSMKDLLQKWKTGGFSKEEKSKFVAAGADSSIFEDPNAFKHYMDTTRANQAQLQMLGSLRDDAISKNHPENGDHSQYQRTDEDDQIYMMASAKMARNASYSDLNKTDVRLRAKMHSHAAGNIDEETGVLTGIRRKDFQIVRKGINGINDWRGTNGRWQNQFSGLAATEDVANFKDDKGVFLLTGKDTKGAVSARFKSMQKRGKLKGKNQDDQQIEVVNDTVNEIYIPQIQENPRDFLMTMAAQTGVTDKDALEKGTMRMKIKTKEGEKAINNISDLLVLIRAGMFGEKVDIPEYKGGEVTDSSDTDAT